MTEANSTIKKDLEDLVNKTIEANKVFIKEGSNLLKQITGNKNGVTTIDFLQNDFFSKALNAYASLNIQYVKNMIDLGISLTKSMSQSGGEDESKTEGEEKTGPAFVLKGEAKAGGSIRLQFSIDNSKTEEVNCEFIHTSFITPDEENPQKPFKITFSPAVFALSPDESQPVDISISIPAKTKPGLYNSDVNVKGFEPAYFQIQVVVN